MMDAVHHPVGCHGGTGVGSIAAHPGLSHGKIADLSHGLTGTKAPGGGGPDLASGNTTAGVAHSQAII